MPLKAPKNEKRRCCYLIVIFKKLMLHAVAPARRGVPPNIFQSGLQDSPKFDEKLLGDGGEGIC